MNFLLTAIVAVLVFGTVVLVHEAGHFFAARHCGIHVEEFSIEMCIRDSCTVGQVEVLNAGC